jgi:hypothetical protein
MAGVTMTTAVRIRADVLGYVAEHPGAGRDAIVRDVFGRSESIRATLDELVGAGELVRRGGGYGPPGWEPPPPVDVVAAWRCRQAEADAAWLAAGRP